jgi:hypothetical protein
VPNKERDENGKRELFSHLCSVVLGNNKLDKIKLIWRIALGKPIIILVSIFTTLYIIISFINTVSGTYVDFPVLYKSIIPSPTPSPRTDNPVKPLGPPGTTSQGIDDSSNSAGTAISSTFNKRAPNLEGKEIGAVLKDLGASGFHYKINSEVNINESGRVTKQVPPNGTGLDPSKGHWEVKCTRSSYLKTIVKPAPKSYDKEPEYIWEDTPDGRKEYKIENSSKGEAPRKITRTIRMPAEYEMRWIVDEK